MTSTVMTDPPTMHAELEAARRRSLRGNPACPSCGRRDGERLERGRYRCPCKKEFATK